MADETVKNGVTEGGEGTPGDAIDGNTPAATSGSAGGKKTKKGKNKTKAAGGEAGPVSGANLSADQQEKLKKAMEMLNLQTQGGAVGQRGAGRGSCMGLFYSPADILQLQPRVRRRRPPSPISSGRHSRCRPLTRSSPAMSASARTWLPRR